MNATKLEQFLLNKIPLSNALSIRLVLGTQGSIEIAAPLAPNVNHLGTVFGGSLNAVLILTCYACLFNALDERGFASHVVLKSCSTKYRHPINSDFSAICAPPSKHEIDRLYETMKRKNRAQILLKAYAQSRGKKSCEFEGIFVAVPDR